MSNNISKNNSYLKISIVTPSFNSAIFIEDCIQSVVNQNYPNYEHIIIDGGSTDGTVEILNKYSHLKWVSEPDEGQSDALNKGFKIANGEIIGWCNSDDVYLKGTFEKVANLLTEEDIDAVYSNLYFGDEKLKITRNLKSHRPVKWLSLFHCFIPSATFFFKRIIIDNGISIDKTKHITMDKDFFARILYSGYKLRYANDYFAVFRWHENNKSLDNKETKYIRSKEGLETLLFITKLNLPSNALTIRAYSIISIILLIYRKYLKIVS